MNYYISTTMLEPVRINLIYMEYESDEEIYKIDLTELDVTTTNTL